MSNERIINVFLDDSASINRTAEVAHEYNTAVSDLLESNYFHLCKNPGGEIIERGPYNLHLSIVENRLLMDIRRLVLLSSGEVTENQREKLTIPMSPFRRVVKDYFFICESYYDAVKQTSPTQLETLDMAKRSVHNDGSELLMDLLTPNIDVDFDTARRIFTLICVLHIR